MEHPTKGNSSKVLRQKGRWGKTSRALRHQALRRAPALSILLREIYALCREGNNEKVVGVYLWVPQAPEFLPRLNHRFQLISHYRLFICSTRKDTDGIQ